MEGKKLKYHSLIDKVYTRPNLYLAWEKVRSNKGSGGVDRVTIEEFERKLDNNIEEIHRLLYEDTYEPLPVRRVWIPKANGKERPLGIPVIRDRVVQQGIVNKLQPIFGKKFLDCSYGYRPGRSTHDAIKKVEEYLREGYKWVVEVDIEKYFDTVNHELLMKLVNEEVADGRVLRLIQKFLRSGVMKETGIEYQVTGTPQGGVISPLLANIYLHEFDRKMMGEGYKIVRYADDVVVMCRNNLAAGKAFKRIKEILEGELMLKLSKEKSKLTHMSKGFEFLGHLFVSNKYGNWKMPRKRAIESFKEKIRWLTRRQQPKSMLLIIEDINPVIRGWGNYFKHSNCKTLFWELDCWTRNRVRAFKVKGWGKRSHLKIPNRKLMNMGLCSLYGLLNRQAGLTPCKGATA
jgi:group II intron reverse transcriptase/maturase